MSAPHSAAVHPDREPDGTPARDALSRLVREVQTSGVSLGQMAARAIDPETGTTLSKPYFQKLAANTVTTAPTPERLRAVAVALRKPISVVQRAAAEQWLDYRATELAGYDEEVRIIVGHLAGKTKPELRRWRAMIEAEERLRDEG